MGRGTKVCSNVTGHMTKIAAMPIYCKNMKNSSSLEQKGRWPWNLVCSIGCSSTTKFVQMVTWVDLDLFYDKVKFGPLCFCMGKQLKQWTFYCCLWYKSWYMQSSKWVHEALWVPKVKVIDWPWSKYLWFNIFKLLFLNTHLADWSQMSYEGGMRKPNFIQIVQVTWQRWPSSSMVFLWNQKADDLETWYTSATKFVQMMPLGWP